MWGSFLEGLRIKKMNFFDRLKENPWDTIDIHYDAGSYSIILHRDGDSKSWTFGPHPSLNELMELVLEWNKDKRNTINIEEN